MCIYVKLLFPSYETFNQRKREKCDAIAGAPNCFVLSFKWTEILKNSVLFLHFWLNGILLIAIAIEYHHVAIKVTSPLSANIEQFDFVSFAIKIGWSPMPIDGSLKNFNHTLYLIECLYFFLLHINSDSLWFNRYSDSLTD